MPLIKSVRGFTPSIPDSCFVAENATIIGDVEMGEDCSIWFNTVVRGDVNSIRLGDRVNIQDGTVIHCTLDKSKVNSWKRRIGRAQCYHPRVYDSR